MLNIISLALTQIIQPKPVFRPQVKQVIAWFRIQYDHSKSSPFGSLSLIDHSDKLFKKEQIVQKRQKTKNNDHALQATNI